MIIEFGSLVAIGTAVVIIIAITKGARVVPQKEAQVVERLGKYSRTLDAGFHVLIPFIDRVTAKHSLKEIPVYSAAANGDRCAFSDVHHPGQHLH